MFPWGRKHPQNVIVYIHFQLVDYLFPVDSGGRHVPGDSGSLSQSVVATLVPVHLGPRQLPQDSLQPGDPRLVLALRLASLACQYSPHIVRVRLSLQSRVKSPVVGLLRLARASLPVVAGSNLQRGREVIRIIIIYNFIILFIVIPLKLTKFYIDEQHYKQIKQIL